MTVVTMTPLQEHDLIVDVFATHDQAVRAVRRLIDAGLPAAHLSLVTQGLEVREDVQGYVTTGQVAAQGAGTGRTGSNQGMGTQRAGQTTSYPCRSAIAATLRAHVPEILDQVQAMPTGWQVLVAVRSTGHWVGVTHVLRLRSLPPVAQATVEVSFTTGPSVSYDDLLAIIQDWAGETREQ